MDEHLRQFCEDFIRAQTTIAKVEPLLSRFVFPICAEQFVEHGVMPDYDELKRCDKLLVKRAGLFSDFSGLSALMVVTQLALSNDPEKRMDELMDARNLLHKYFPPAPDYVSLAAIVLTDSDRSEWEDIAARSKDIYESIKKRHKLLSSGGDIVYAVILAKSGKDVSEIPCRSDLIYSLVKKTKMDPQSLLALARVLALSGLEPEESSQRFLDLYDSLNARGCKYGREYQIPMLGLAACLPEDLSVVADQITQADAFLAEQPNYKGLIPRYSKTVRLMHAAMLVCGNHNRVCGDECKNNDSGLSNTDKNVLIAMEITIWTLFSILFI